METFKDANNVKITVEKATAPAHWASYLINGDKSGLEYCSPDEIADADRFCNFFGPYGHIVDAVEMGFSWTNDAGADACDMAEYTFLVREGK